MAEEKKKEAERKEEKVEKKKEEKKKVEKVAEEIKEEEAKEEKKEEKEEKGLLVPLDEYMRSGLYLGTKVISAHMRKYVYRRRADGLATINTKKIDDMLRIAASFLSLYSPKEIIVVCKRQSGWNGAIQFGKATGIRVFAKKYSAGIITNVNLQDFFEPSLMFIADPWLDRIPLLDAIKLNIPIIALCDTNNLATYADLIVPCNNKSGKSLGLIFWILAREYMKKRNIKAPLPAIEEFVGEEPQDTNLRKI